MKHDTAADAMTTSKRLLSPPAAPRGIVRASLADGVLQGRRVLPARDLAPYIHHFWSVRWDLRSPFTAVTLPHPAARIVVLANAGEVHADVAGVYRGSLSKTLFDQGQMFGVQFRPATFQPLLRAAMATLTDREVPVGELLGAEAQAWARDVLLPASIEEQVDLTETFLRAILPALPVEVARVRDLVERMSTDRTLLRVERAAQVAGIDMRTLQRRFQRYIGTTPKAVAQRYRVHEAAEQLRTPSRPQLAVLASTLGYADQAHFVREFRAATGRTPGTFTSGR